MKNQRFRYRRHGLKTFDEKPECTYCDNGKVNQTQTRDVPFKHNHGGPLTSHTSFVYMCCNCGEVLGYADNRVKPTDIVRAHEKPDLSAKYEGGVI